MKISFNSLFAIALTATVLTTSAFTSTAFASTNPIVKTTTEAKNFNRISVKGNVELLIVQSNNESVKFADDNKGTASVTKYGDLLTITSTDKNEKVKLVVYVNDIYRIQASGNAEVKTDGKLNVKYLQVFLTDDAKADIKTNSESIYTVLDNYSSLKLGGNADQHILTTSSHSTLTMDKFAATATVVTNSFEVKDAIVLAK